MGHRAILKILTRKILTLQGFKPQIIQPTAQLLYCAISLTFHVTNGKCIADKIKYTKDYFQSNITTNTYGIIIIIIIVASHHIFTVMNNNNLCDPGELNGMKETQFHGALKPDENEKTSLLQSRAFV
jgi:hypothetical protein